MLSKLQRRDNLGLDCGLNEAEEGLRRGEAGVEVAMMISVNTLHLDQVFVVNCLLLLL